MQMKAFKLMGRRVSPGSSDTETDGQWRAETDGQEGVLCPQKGFVVTRT